VIPKRIAIVIIVLAVLMMGGASIHFSTYRPGWELSAEIVALHCDGVEEEIHNAIGSVVEWDPDEADYGRPNIIATVDEVYEITPAMGYETLQSDVENFRYIAEMHEYLFELQIKTFAGMYVEDIWGLNHWVHETSMPYEWHNNLGTGGSRIGKSFDGGVYVRFANLPWGLPDFGPAPEGYQFNAYWLGIMSAEIGDSIEGIATENPPPQTYTGWGRKIAASDGPINMFTDDGTFAAPYAEIPWDPEKVLDENIKSTVIVEVPISLMAGAYENYNVWADIGAGDIVDCKPIDYYVQYTVKMKCLVIKAYEYRDPGIDPNPSPIQPPNDYVPWTAPSWLAQYGMWIILGIVAVIVVLFFLSIFTGMGLFSILTHIFHFYDAGGGMRR
jgi:hypothetical protein